MRRLGEEVAGPHFPLQKEAGCAKIFRYFYRFLLCLTIVGHGASAGQLSGPSVPSATTTDDRPSAANPVVQMPWVGPEGMLPGAQSDCLVPADEVASNQAAYDQKRKQRTVAVGHKMARACFVSLRAVLGPWAKGQLTLVDIRSPEKFSRYRIPGSLNIPAHILKTKAFLKSRHVVLVDEGQGVSQLLAACKQLRRAGFMKVSVLRGGLNYWRHKVGPLQGDKSAQRELDMLSPRQYFREQVYDWLVVNATSLNGRRFTEVFGDRSIILYKNNPELFLRDLRAAIERTETTIAPSIVVIGDDDQQYQFLRDVLNKAGIYNVFYLQGGVKAYEAFLADQQAVWKRLARGPKVINRCTAL